MKVAEFGSEKREKMERDYLTKVEEDRREREKKRLNCGCWRHGEEIGEGVENGTQRYVIVIGNLILILF